VDRRSRAARAERLDAREALLDAALTICAERGYVEASIDEIVARAGYSKGAMYWHFSSKDELMQTLFEERVDRPWREVIALLKSAPPEKDMAEEATRRFAELIDRRPEMTLITHQFFTHAARDEHLRRAFAKRYRALRVALGKAVVARLERLNAPPLQMEPEAMAAAFLGLALGLSQQKLIDPRCVPGDLFGQVLALIYAGHVARAGGERRGQ
jgi:AcrR family transcriptional regulator